MQPVLYVSSLEEFIEINEGTSIIYEDSPLCFNSNLSPEGCVFGKETPRCTQVFVGSAQILLYVKVNKFVLMHNHVYARLFSQPRFDSRWQVPPLDLGMLHYISTYSSYKQLVCFFLQLFWSFKTLQNWHICFAFIFTGLSDRIHCVDLLFKDRI